jgi:biotin synthase
MADNRLTIDEIERWLRQTNPDRLEQLWRQADTVRRQFVGNAVHLRGLIEISNHCVRGCRYCGLNAANDSLVRYRMSAEEILACAHLAVEFGYGTIVIQAGEDPGIETDWLADIVRRIKQQTPAIRDLGYSSLRCDPSFVPRPTEPY